VNQVTNFLKRSFPSAHVKVTTDLEIGIEATFGSEQGILLIAGTGSVAFGRDANGRTARAGGRGPWFSDEGSAFDIGRAAMRAVVLAEDGRGPATELSKRIFSWNQATNWDGLLDQASKDADALFSRTFPLVAQLADRGDTVCCDILAAAADSLAGLAGAVARDLGWAGQEVAVAKIGGVYGRSKYFDGKIDAAIKKTLPRARFVPVLISPAEVAARMSLKLAETQNHAA
jgi:N-acetylglucosamine kinase-like BadF-type ATPase